MQPNRVATVLSDFTKGLSTDYTRSDNLITRARSRETEAARTDESREKFWERIPRAKHSRVIP